MPPPRVGASRYAPEPGPPHDLRRARWLQESPAISLPVAAWYTLSMMSRWSVLVGLASKSSNDPPRKSGACSMRAAAAAWTASDVSGIVASCADGEKAWDRTACAASSFFQPAKKAELARLLTKPMESPPSRRGRVPCSICSAVRLMPSRPSHMATTAWSWARRTSPGQGRTRSKCCGPPMAAYRKTADATWTGSPCATRRLSSVPTPLA